MRAQLRPLLVLGQHIAFLGRGKAALAGEAELIERRELRGLVDAALEIVLAFELAGLGRHDAEHDLLAFRQHAQRLEAAGARVVVFHEIAVHVDLVEQDLLHGVVAARAHEGRFVVAAAHVHRDRHVGGDVRHRHIDEVAVDFAELFGIVAAVAHLLAILLVAQHRDEHLVELEIAAAGVREGAHRLAVGLPDIVEEGVEIGIGRLVDRRRRRAAVDRGRRRNGDLRRDLGVRGDELVVLDHRMAGEADLAGHLDALGARLHAREGDAVSITWRSTPSRPQRKSRCHQERRNSPSVTALQPDLFLLADDALDLAVFDRLEVGRRNLALGALRARLLQGGRAQQAADMVGAERRLGALHRLPHTSSAISTIMRSFAHCSSSASTLPSSVEAKPHCGDSAS